MKSRPFLFTELLLLFSQTAEYALRAVADLARHPDEARTVQQVAEATCVPPDYLAKILKDLGRLGLVTSQRGPRGGFRLAREAGDLTVLEVVQAVDPLQRIRSCPLGLKEHKTGLCPLHRLVDDAIASVEKALGAVTFGKLVERTPAHSAMCDPLDRKVTLRVQRAPRR